MGILYKSSQKDRLATTSEAVYSCIHIQTWIRVEVCVFVAVLSLVLFVCRLKAQVDSMFAEVPRTLCEQTGRDARTFVTRDCKHLDAQLGSRLLCSYRLVLSATDPYIYKLR